MAQAFLTEDWRLVQLPRAMRVGPPEALVLKETFQAWVGRVCPALLLLRALDNSCFQGHPACAAILTFPGSCPILRVPLPSQVSFTLGGL